MNLKNYKYNFNFFKWIKKAELVELNEINTEDDPIRPELSNEFRTSEGRKIFGLKYNEEIEGVACLAFTTDIPTTVKELELITPTVSALADIVHDPDMVLKTKLSPEQIKRREDGTVVVVDGYSQN